ncbi:anti-sigma factor antagonist [Streptomyces gardneri]|uniref:anti-sigma factor antagonist n=1 Tax=Nocardia TaxID=1817 RepID=UPI00135ABD13|nr:MULTISPECIES: anti-sigma factor antagonist [Nocardia]MBF6168878.1 anti-sigma factor antagonist [Streptomyces gardneri]MBF6208714.1 anti-sigma factor antagonist [Streptomyces gardneri]
MSTALHGQSGPLHPPTDEPEDARRRLNATIEHRGSAVVLHARGEIDAYTLPTWRRLLREAAAATAAPNPIVIDTTGLDFMACRSLLVLAEESERCRHQGMRLCVVGRSVLARIVTLIDLDAQLPIYSCVEDAVADSALNGRSHGCRAAGQRGTVASVAKIGDPSGA